MPHRWPARAPRRLQPTTELRAFARSSVSNSRSFNSFVRIRGAKVVGELFLQKTNWHQHATDDAMSEGAQCTKRIAPAVQVRHQMPCLQSTPQLFQFQD